MAQDIYLKRIPQLDRPVEEMLHIHQSIDQLATNDLSVLKSLHPTDVLERLRTVGTPGIIERKTLAETLGYWSNDVALATWFRNRFGNKEEQRHHVTKDVMDDLLDTMKRVLDRRDPAYAAEHLPETVPFNLNGRKPYDLSYFSELRDSHIQLLTACIRTDVDTDYLIVELFG